MDDKRTLLAFLLVGLIFLLMPYYYELLGVAKSTPGRQTAAESAGKAAEEEGDVGTRPEPMEVAPVAEQRGLSEAVEPVASRLIEVVTPLQRLVFSTDGGVLVSAQLRRYDKASGGPVEMLPPRGYGLGLRLFPETGSGAEYDLTHVHFEPDRSGFEVDAGGEDTLRLRAVLANGGWVEKLIRVRGDQYGAELSVRATGFLAGTVAELSWVGGIGLAEREPKLDVGSMRALAFLNESLTQIQVDEGESDSWQERGEVRWAGVRNRYFFIAFAPVSEGRHRVSLSGRGVSAEPYREYQFSVGVRLEDLAGQWDLLVYVGPLEIDAVTRYQRDFARAMDLGFPVVRQIAKVLLKLFVEAHQFIPNYGWVIVVFGIVVKILVYPLTHKSYESAAKMQELQPKIMVLREKYRNNSQRLSQETMKLYREEGVNPLGGCLPLLLQMPIFIALYQVFSSAIQLRQAPFIWWIDDLSLPDSVYMGGFAVHVLPVLMAAAMFVQSKMTMKDPKQAALVYVMPAVMVFIMWSFSSGLVLYWTVFNVLQIGQQYVTNRLQHARIPSAQAVSRGGAAGGERRGRSRVARRQ